jgi:hypothetical protein
MEAFNEGNLSSYDVSPGSLNTAPSPSLSLDGEDEMYDYGGSSSGMGFSMGLGNLASGMSKRFSFRGGENAEGEGGASKALLKLRSQAKQNIDSLESRMKETRERLGSFNLGSIGASVGSGSQSGAQWDAVDRAIMKHSQIPGLQVEQTSGLLFASKAPIKSNYEDAVAGDPGAGLLVPYDAYYHPLNDSGGGGTSSGTTSAAATPSGATAKSTDGRTATPSSSASSSSLTPPPKAAPKKDYVKPTVLPDTQPLQWRPGRDMDGAAFRVQLVTQVADTCHAYGYSTVTLLSAVALLDASYCCVRTRNAFNGRKARLLAIISVTLAAKVTEPASIRITPDLVGEEVERQLRARASAEYRPSAKDVLQSQLSMLQAVKYKVRSQLVVDVLDRFWARIQPTAEEEEEREKQREGGQEDDEPSFEARQRASEVLQVLVCMCAGTERFSAQMRARLSVDVLFATEAAGKVKPYNEDPRMNALLLEVMELVSRIESGKCSFKSNTQYTPTDESKAAGSPTKDAVNGQDGEADEETDESGKDVKDEVKEEAKEREQKEERGVESIESCQWFMCHQAEYEIIRSRLGIKRGYPYPERAPQVTEL